MIQFLTGIAVGVVVMAIVTIAVILINTER